MINSVSDILMSVKCIESNAKIKIENRQTSAVCVHT